MLLHGWLGLFTTALTATRYLSCFEEGVVVRDEVFFFQRLGLESETGPWVTRAPLVSSPRAQGPVRELIQLQRHHNPVKIHAMACHHAMTWMAWIVHHGAHHNSLLEEFFELCVPTSALVSMAAPAPASVSVRCQCQRQYRCQCQRQCQRQHQSQCQCQYQ